MKDDMSIKFFDGGRVTLYTNIYTGGKLLSIREKDCVRNVAIEPPPKKKANAKR